MVASTTVRFVGSLRFRSKMQTYRLQHYYDYVFSVRRASDDVIVALLEVDVFRQLRLLARANTYLCKLDRPLSDDDLAMMVLAANQRYRYELSS